MRRGSKRTPMWRSNVVRNGCTHTALYHLEKERNREARRKRKPSRLTGQVFMEVLWVWLE